MKTGFITAVSRYLPRLPLQPLELEVLLRLFITRCKISKSGEKLSHKTHKVLHSAKLLFLSLPAHTGLSGSMNFDEASENEGDAEDGSRSLSPNTDTTRPASATSGKEVPVSCSLSC